MNLLSYLWDLLFGRTGYVVWIIGPVTQQQKERYVLFKLTDEQKFPLAVSFRTAAGNPAKVDGLPVWGVSNPDVLDMAVADDGLSAVFSAKGPLGTCQVNLTADADLGAGVKNLTGMFEVEVVSAEASVVVFTPGEPTVK